MGQEQGKLLTDDDVRKADIAKMDAEMSRKMGRGVDWNCASAEPTRNRISLDVPLGGLIPLRKSTSASLICFMCMLVCARS